MALPKRAACVEHGCHGRADCELQDYHHQQYQSGQGMQSRLPPSGMQLALLSGRSAETKCVNQSTQSTHTERTHTCL